MIDQAPSFLELGQEIGRLAAPMHKAQVLHDVGMMQGLKDLSFRGQATEVRATVAVGEQQLERDPRARLFIVVTECAHQVGDPCATECKSPADSVGAVDDVPRTVHLPPAQLGLREAAAEIWTHFSLGLKRRQTVRAVPSDVRAGHARMIPTPSRRFTKIGTLRAGDQTMTQTVCFGLIRETLPNERRVALTPEGAERLTSAGHAVLVEAGAGENAGFDDGDYRAVGARICLTATEVGHGADVLVKLHGPSSDEHVLIRDGGAITGFLHLASPSGGSLRALIRERRLHAIAWELVEEADRSRPVLEAVSAIGGRVAVLLACCPAAVGGGTGRLLGGAGRAAQRGGHRCRSSR